MFQSRSARRALGPTPGGAGAILRCLLAAIHIRVYDPEMKSGDIIVALQKDGWYQVATKGSHVQFKHPEKPGRVTVPHPKRDIPIGTLKSIEKQAGLKLR